MNPIEFSNIPTDRILKKPSREELQAAPDLVVSDPEGRTFEVPEFAVAGRAGLFYAVPEASDFIDQPEGSDLFALPDRDPVGFDRRTGQAVRLTKIQGQPVRATASFMAPAHTATWWSAFEKQPHAKILPMFAYTALGWLRGRFVSAGVRIDSDIRQDHRQFPCDDEMEKRGRKIIEARGENNLIRHVVANCALTYRCPAARNYVMGRWEAPLPISPGCNAECVGCISEPPQEQEIPPTQPRLRFLPTVEEIVDLAVPHLETAELPVVSFGQGCEGEPLLRSDTIDAAIRLIRKRTQRGVINLNTNAGLPLEVERLAKTGLDSIRISLNSARKGAYERYYRPKTYTFEDVITSGLKMRAAGKWISLNYFIFPGFTDDPEETAAFLDLCRRIRPNLIQMRNLNMDPDLYASVVEMRTGIDTDGAPIGIRRWMAKIQKELPGLRFGYFNPPREKWGL
ncbi:MAG: radical SAM protein [Candidatus Eisenbacteria bacterium]|uniref:Radical SAM protein n=1 Tax=Eiseniibacteriota bacterium TaxID=2212470 RepID=A0A948RTA8_UNCEI|nr:radical SAM protein [Candidatus Eisenbacteria bacterium]MBU1948160.1 radical SAM protein [Candidatus Eisenbacteria bacterium]MBU2690171.1 radical SAM protein [Candidatus Eisenbacteria bacterium]